MPSERFATVRVFTVSCAGVIQHFLAYFSAGEEVPFSGSTTMVSSKDFQVADGHHKVLMLNIAGEGYVEYRFTNRGGKISMEREGSAFAREQFELLRLHGLNQQDARRVVAITGLSGVSRMLLFAGALMEMAHFSASAASILVDGMLVRSRRVECLRIDLLDLGLPIIEAGETKTWDILRGVQLYLILLRRPEVVQRPALRLVAS